MVSVLPQLITKVTDHSGERIALSYLEHHVSYDELVRRSNSLAHCLIELGVRHGDRVGIFMGKSIETVVAIYGILKAGAAYVPLDSFAPQARLRQILCDCEVHYVITKEIKRQQIRSLLTHPVPLTHLVGLNGGDDIFLPCISWQEVYSFDAEEEPSIAGSEMDIAYILYTSGSTGEAKGIIHTHRSALSFIEWAAREFAVVATDRLSSHAQFHFDLSIFDLFVSAATGASVTLVPENVALLPASLAKFIEDEQITVWYSVPFALLQLVTRGNLGARNLSALRCVLFAGERFPLKHLAHMMTYLPHARFCNLYGPTETNVCTFYTVSPPVNEGISLPIGYACANAELLVIDNNGYPLPVGSVGELVVRGHMVMQGYWGKPDLNRQAFVSVLEDERPFYRTGDLVQSQEDGTYDLIGRKDRQIKLRGYRIELDEIEAVLASHPTVEEAVIYFEEATEGGSIRAIVLPGQRETLESTLLMAYLRERLPPYSLPEQIFIVRNLPRTSTGKVNRLHLSQWLSANQAKMQKNGESG